MSLFSVHDHAPVSRIHDCVVTVCPVPVIVVGQDVNVAGGPGEVVAFVESVGLWVSAGDGCLQFADPGRDVLSLVSGVALRVFREDRGLQLVVSSFSASRILKNSKLNPMRPA